MQERKAPASIDLTEKAKDESVKEILPEMIRNIRVNIGGRDLRLVYDMRVQLQAEQELDIDFSELNERLGKQKKNSVLVMKVIRLMANEALRIAGEPADITDEWLMDHMQPGYMTGYRIAAMAAVTAGWFMETDNSYNEEQDVTLNEIRKKNENTD